MSKFFRTFGLRLVFNNSPEATAKFLLKSQKNKQKCLFCLRIPKIFCTFASETQKKGKTIMMNPVQIEMLSAMSEMHTQEDLLSLKRFLVAFYAERVDAAMDKLWESGTLNEQKLQDLKTAHRRTAYV